MAAVLKKPENWVGKFYVGDHRGAVPEKFSSFGSNLVSDFTELSMDLFDAVQQNKISYDTDQIASLDDRTTCLAALRQVRHFGDRSMALEHRLNDGIARLKIVNHGVRSTLDTHAAEALDSRLLQLQDTLQRNKDTIQKLEDAHGAYNARQVSLLRSPRAARSRAQISQKP